MNKYDKIFWIGVATVLISCGAIFFQLLEAIQTHTLLIDTGLNSTPFQIVWTIISLIGATIALLAFALGSRSNPNGHP